MQAPGEIKQAISARRTARPERALAAAAMTNPSGYNFASDATVFPLLCGFGLIIEGYATRRAGPY